MIAQNIIEQVQAASDIVEVVSSYLPLKRAGRSYKACCPFHGEKTPSFFVNPDKQIWHCFGCGAGGSVFNFVMSHERVSFPEAVRLLGKRAGISIPEESRAGEEKREKKDELYRVNEFSASWFKRQLLADAGEGALAYLRSRGISDAFIEQFSLGFAPDAWDGLTGAARARGFPHEALLGLGLTMRHEATGRLYDRFRNRLMIPISDVSGRIIAFSGRVLGDGTPKYMNSPESVLFNKSNSLFGLFHAKRAIADEGAAIVVEGYFDFFALYAAGIANVVASQGTALTADHLRTLRRYAREIVMCFDADEAGRSVAPRSAELMGELKETPIIPQLQNVMREGLRIRVLLLPKSHDPDSFVRARGRESFLELARGAKDYFDYYLDFLCDSHNPKSEYDKMTIAMEFLSHLTMTTDRIQHSVFRDVYRAKLSERLGVSQSAIAYQESLLDGKKSGRVRGAPHRETSLKPQHPTGEMEIVRIMLAEEGILHEVASLLAPDDFRDSHLKRIVETAFALLRENRWSGCARLVAHLDDEETARVASRLAAEGAPAGNPQTIARDCVCYLKKRNLKEEIRRITQEIARREKNGSPEDEIRKLQRLLIEKDIARHQIAQRRL